LFDADRFFCYNWLVELMGRWPVFQPPDWHNTSIRVLILDKYQGLWLESEDSPKRQSGLRPMRRKMVSQ